MNSFQFWKEYYEHITRRIHYWAYLTGDEHRSAVEDLKKKYKPSVMHNHPKTFRDFFEIYINLWLVNTYLNWKAQLAKGREWKGYSWKNKKDYLTDDYLKEFFWEGKRNYHGLKVNDKAEIIDDEAPIFSESLKIDDGWTETKESQYGADSSIDSKNFSKKIASNYYDGVDLLEEDAK